jgi:hypothetical protein
MAYKIHKRHAKKFHLEFKNIHVSENAKKLKFAFFPFWQNSKKGPFWAFG